MTTACKTKPISDHKDLVEKFAKALAHYRVDMIEQLLSEDGEYNYYDIDGEEEEEGDKQGMIEYLKRVCEPLLFTASEPATVEYDQCLFCKVGNPVVLFNGGTFPHNPIEFYERNKQGLMLEFKDDLICGITFCGTFIKTENDYNYRIKDFRPPNPFYDNDNLDE
jgi:hypothetical protein